MFKSYHGRNLSTKATVMLWAMVMIKKMEVRALSFIREMRVILLKMRSSSYFVIVNLTLSCSSSLLLTALFAYYHAFDR